MTINIPVKCKSCGEEFCFSFTPFAHPDYLRKGPLNKFVCAQCGDKNSECKRFRKEWEDFAESVR
jgi:hypothetical protein